MAKNKTDHPLVGKIFLAENQKYRVQGVDGQTVFASKMIDDTTCQRGRPSKFELSKTMMILGLTMESLAAEAAASAAKRAASKVRPKKIESAQPELPIAPTPPKLSEEELEARKRSIANLIAMLPDNTTTSDW